MVISRELSAILGLQMRTTLVFVGIAIDWPEDLTNQPHGPVLRLQAARIAAFANAETRAAACAPFLRIQYLPINLPPQQHQDHSARDPNIGGLIPLDSHLSVGSGAGTVERSLLMAKSRVRFISETTLGTVR
jgi:hypothetical protein